MISVNNKRCPSNHACPMVRKCPAQAILQKGFDAPTIDQTKCQDCGICLKNCPYKAFQKTE